MHRVADWHANINEFPPKIVRGLLAWYGDCDEVKLTYDKVHGEGVYRKEFNPIIHRLIAEYMDCEVEEWDAIIITMRGEREVLAQ